MKKILTSFLLIALLFGSIPSKASALDITALQQLIKSLQEQLAQMQTTVVTSPSVGGGSGGSHSSCPVFSLSLTVGSTGPEVTKLQQFLLAKGWLSLENVSGYFGPLTKAALAKYQTVKGIVPGSGYFGPITIAAVNAECTVNSNTPKVRLLSPNGGELLTEGDSLTIKWGKSNLPVDSKIRLTVYKGDKADLRNRSRDIIDLPSDFKSYTWKVEADNSNWGVGKTSIPEKVAKILGIPSANADIVNNQYIIALSVASKEGKEIAFDSSDKPFTIFKQNDMSVNFIYPTGGEKFVPGQKVQVKYSVNGFPRPIQVAVQLNDSAIYPDGPFNPVSNQNQPYKPATGVYEFTIPSGVKSGSDYSFLLSTDHPTTETSIGDGYSRRFSIVSGDTTSTSAQPGLQVIFPKAGSQFVAGQSYRVLWSGWDYYNGTKVTDYSVYLVGGNFEKGSMFLGTVDKNKQDWFEWKVPSYLTPASNYKIQFSGKYASGDNSDSFSIVSGDTHPTPTASIKVLSPNGGEYFRIGDSMTVKWDKGTCKEDRVSVVLRNQSGFQGPDDSGDQAGYTENDGSNTWIIGNIGAGGQYRARVLCEVDGSNRYYDDSDREFTIAMKLVPPTPTLGTISVFSPSVGNTFSIGSRIKVEWTTKNIPTTEKLLIRLRNYATGQEYNLASSVLNDENESVVISPSIPEGSYKLEIKSSQSVIGSSGMFKLIGAPVTTPTVATPTVTISKVGTGTGTVYGTGINCGTDCSEVIPVGGSITLSAYSDPKSLFSGWSGACTGSVTCTLSNINENKTVIAGFRLNPSFMSHVDKEQQIASIWQALEALKLQLANQ